jgi:SAM-dependent methyltransferase
MDLRTKALYALSRRLLTPPAARTTDYGAYDRWRHESLARSWSSFSDWDVAGRDVLDFGCGDGQLSLLLSSKGAIVVGVDLNPSGIERARQAASGRARFVLGTPDGIPLPDASFDVVVAFDCLEHVMTPTAILREWRRVLRPGGRCLIEWYPYTGPWGPHMESLIPLPWAHYLFGQRAMFRAAERIYELPEFQARHWDLDEHGRRKPNKWRAWSSFREQGYINELTIAQFCAIARDCGLRVARLERRGFNGSPARRAIGRTLTALPLVGQFFVSYAVVELERTGT